MEDHSQDRSDGRGVSRHAMEIVTALLTGAIGVAVCYGSYEIGIAWEETGPASGYFPFYIGILILVGSAVNLGRALILKHHAGEIFLEAASAKRVASFFLPIVGFAIVSVFLGLYVGTILYVATAMVFLGGYPIWRAALTSVVIAVSFYVIFELGFQVPLLKGPIEAAFGIY